MRLVVLGNMVVTDHASLYGALDDLVRRQLLSELLCFGRTAAGDIALACAQRHGIPVRRVACWPPPVAEMPDAALVIGPDGPSIEALDRGGAAVVECAIQNAALAFQVKHVQRDLDGYRSDLRVEIKAGRGHAHRALELAFKIRGRQRLLGLIGVQGRVIGGAGVRSASAIGSMAVSSSRE